MNLDPIHWLAVALAVVSVILGGYAWDQSEKYDNTREQYRLYQGQIQAEINRDKAAFKAAEAANKLDNEKLERRLANAQTTLDKLYIDYDRMRKQSANLAAENASLSGAARQLEISEAARARLAGALERLESGVLQRLAKPRDETINLLNECIDFTNGN